MPYVKHIACFKMPKMKRRSSSTSIANLKLKLRSGSDNKAGASHQHLLSLRYDVAEQLFARRKIL
jgi:hypothetical protein